MRFKAIPKYKHEDPWRDHRANPFRMPGIRIMRSRNLSLSKRSILSALGRGAFRLDKTVRSTTFMTTNCSEFQMNCLKPNLLHFDVHDHILGVSVLKNKIKNSDMKRLGYSLNLMNYFYGAASSFSRMEIYRFIIFQQTISPRIDLALIRFDVDSVIFVINGDQSLGWNLIHNFLDESTYKYKKKDSTHNEQLAYLSSQI